MNVNQLINMVIRQVMRRLVNKGVGAGMDRLSRMGGADEAKPRGKNAPANSAQGAAAGARMRKSARLMRRIGRF